MKNSFFIAAASIIFLWCLAILSVVVSGFYGKSGVFNATINSILLYSAPAFNVCAIALGVLIAKRYFNVQFQWKAMAIGAALLSLTLVGSYPATIPLFAKTSSQQVDLLNMAINSHIENRLLTRIVCAKSVDADDLKLFQQYERAEWDAFAPELAKKCKSTITGSEHRMVPTVAGVNL